MTLDANFWVAVSFFIFLGGLIYLKVPKKINDSLGEKINEIKKEINDAEKLRDEAKSVLIEYEKKIDKSKKETIEIINTAKKESENIFLEKTNKFHLQIEERKKNTELKIDRMKSSALSDIKNASIKIGIEAVENLMKNSIDKSKIENIYNKSIEQTIVELKKIKA
tara:strand:+ start:8655 stop:9152 length:498 start_codon:yes stop_codon:yes gene_type:complete